MSETNLDAWRRAWQDAARSLEATIARMQARITEVNQSPAMREARSKRRYREAVAQQQQIGRDFVQAEAARARAELGLPNHPFDPGWSCQSTRCNHLVLRDGYGDECGLVRGAHD